MDEKKITNEGEMSLKELILKIKDYLKEIIKSWWIVALFCLVSAAGFIYNQTNFKPTYKAELRFMVEGQSGGGGGISSLLGSFGINKGGKVNPYKILEVAKSKSILIKVLSSNFENNENIANAILKSYDLPEKWSLGKADFKDFLFKDSISILSSELERNGIKRLSRFVWGSDKIEPLTQLNLNENTGIYSLTTNAISEELSLRLTNAFYDQIKVFFEEEVFQNQKQLANILKMKSDSIKTLNESIIRQMAQFEDRNRDLISRQSMVTKSILKQENIALTTAYAEIMRSKEMTDVNLKDMQPLFMAIDTPFSPIAPSSMSMLMAIIKGIIIGGFFAVFLIVIRKIYKDVMSS